MDSSADAGSDAGPPPSLWARALGVGGDPEPGALRDLAGAYWYCVYVWWRRAGLDPVSTATATLATFELWLGESPPNAKETGAARMRDWMLARLPELAGRGVKLKGEPALAIDQSRAEKRYAEEPEGNPGAIFQRRWAMTVTESAASLLRDEYAARGEEKLYAELVSFTGFEETDEDRYSPVAQRLGQSAGAVRKAVFDFRTRQRELVHQLVSDTVLDPADAASEITALVCACDAAGATAAALPTALHGLRPDEILVRAMHSVRMTRDGSGSWQAPSIAEAALLFPQYEIVSLVGRGGMGAVYRGRQVELDRPVAIKLLPLEVSVDPSFADRFRREARAMAKLHHPNIILIHEFGSTFEGHLFFVMEFVEGADLHQMIHGPGVTPEQSLAIISGVCDALAYAHAKGVVHRDIKPANVMVSIHGEVKVADFGLARLLDPGAEQIGQTVTGNIMGTPDYMAPEQTRGMNVDHRADIYSLGVMLYEMLCGEVPRGIFDPPSIRVPGINPGIDQVVIKAMQQHPDRRYQTTVEMKTDVSLAREPAPAVAKTRPASPPKAAPKAAPKPEPKPKAAPKPKPVKAPQDRAGGRKRGKRTYAVIGVALALLALVGVLLNSGGSKPQAGNTGAPLANFTKDAPFVNSLGMKFVPVPGTRVLFSIWHTRVADYSVYAKATNADDSWQKQQHGGEPVSREPEYPVVGVNWGAAQGFCQWLTERDTTAGKLPQGAMYRLPTDEEWSIAVGLPPETGTTPKEKAAEGLKIGKYYPWGQDFPPVRKKVGNYADETFHAKFPPTKEAPNGWIEGYTDGYATTSPVGSFPANQFGLYDMGGNVSHWCEDWYDDSKTKRVLRGEHFAISSGQTIQSSYRYSQTPQFRGFGGFSGGAGFRCVLDMGSSALTPASDPLSMDSNSAAPVPERIPTPPVTPKHTIDLLTLIDPAQDVNLGSTQWELQDSVLRYLASTGNSDLRIPLEINSKFYQLEFEFSARLDPANKDHRIEFMLPNGQPGSEIAVRFLSDGNVHVGPSFPSNSQLHCKWPSPTASSGVLGVRFDFRNPGSSKLEILRNGAVVGTWTGDSSTLSRAITAPNAAIHGKRIGLGCSPVSPEFRNFTLTLLEGEATTIREPKKTFGSPSATKVPPPRSAKQTIDLLALVDPVKDRMAKQGLVTANEWEKAGEILKFLCSDGKQGKIGAPVSLLARSYEIEVGYRTATTPNRLHLDLPVSEKRMLPLEINWTLSTITLNGEAIASIEKPESAVTGKIVVRVEVGDGANSKMILLMDGMQKAAWSGDLATFAKNVEVFHPGFPNQALPALVPFGPSFEFTKWELRVFEGEAKVLRGPEAADPGASQPWVVYPPAPGPGAGKHVVFLAGDDEYRSEESLPMLAKILSQRHGFKCTVLFPVDRDGFINTTTADNLPGAEALDSADAIVMLVRWRAWPDAQMKHFADAYLRGVPIIGLRSSTHAFKPAANSSYKQFADFGKRVLGEGWVGHWGAIKREGTRGVIEPLAKDDPILRGVDKVFASREPYEAYPPADARILMRGEVVKGLNPGDPAADYKKRRSTDKVEQDVNNPMMPIAWTRDYRNEGGRTNRIFCTTMGGPGDFQNEGVRRLVINSVYALLGLEVPAKADVSYVGEFAPSSDAMNGYKKGVRPSDLALPLTTASSGRIAPATATPAVPGRLINLLPLVDVKRDAIKGVWSSKPEGLALAQPTDFGVLELPYEPPAEYDYEAEFTPTGNGNNPNLYLNAGGASFAWKVNAHGRTPPIYGLDLLDGKLMPARTEAVATNPLRIETGQRYTTRVEVRRDGLRGFVNGKEMLHWTGDFKRLSMEAGSKLRNERALGVGSYKRAVLFHRIEVREVNGAGRLTANVGPAANNTPSAATKDAPFVNTLGMKFVPVPITGGPTDGERVLFSVWETRVQDYETFANETKRKWPVTNFQQGPDHPAVMVSWEDAKAFCEWITLRERAAGKISSDEEYRLPSDHEWSCAVGIGGLEDAAKLPVEKREKIQNVYSWGAQWPPPKGSGNFSGEELKGIRDDAGILSGYSDGYLKTSPVGSFEANLHGVLDMDGNVLEWCNDWYDNTQKIHLLRGGSWMSYSGQRLNSSFRVWFTASRTITDFAGFRCVLVSSASATSPAASP